MPTALMSQMLLTPVCTVLCPRVRVSSDQVKKTLATCVPPQHHKLQELEGCHRLKAEGQTWSSKPFPVLECNLDFSVRIGSNDS